MAPWLAWPGMADTGTFRAFRAITTGDSIERGVVDMSLDELPDDGALVEVQWSSVNYKDGLAATPTGKVARISPLVPGVALIEALAQLAGIALVSAEGRPLRGYLGEVTRMRFHRLIRPGEEIVLAAVLEQGFGSFARFAVRAEVAGELAAEGSLVLVRK